MKKLKKIVACALLGATLANTGVTYGLNVKKLVCSRYGIGLAGLGLMGASRILSFQASQDNIALGAGQITDPSIIENERILSSYCHNIGSLAFLLSIPSPWTKLCAFVSLLHLLGCNCSGSDAGNV